DQRLDQLVSEGRSATSQIERRVSAVDRAVANLDRQRPDVPAIDSPALTAPASPLDQALQEIAERQRALDGELQPRRADLPRPPPPTPPPARPNTAKAPNSSSKSPRPAQKHSTPPASPPRWSRGETPPPKWA